MAKKPLFSDEEIAAQPADDGVRTRPVNQAPDDGARTRIVTPPGDDAAATRPVADAPPSDPPAGRDAHGHARPATRIHGYGSDTPAPAETKPPEREVTGWLVVVDGPGRGAAVSLGVGMNALGRGEDLNAAIDFGDETISREAHAFVTYDHEQRKFHVSHGGKANVVRLNDDPVLTSQEMSAGDKIRIGATTLQFVAFCGPDFDWAED